MIKPGKYFALASLLALVVGTPVFAGDTTKPADGLAPYFTAATPGAKPVEATGFLQRWLWLEPIKQQGLRSNAGFTDAFLQKTFNAELFPNQLTVIPKDGEQVTVAGDQLTWHALDTATFNAKLFRLAAGLHKQTYGVLFWGVTIVNSPREMQNVRLSVGCNGASQWWVNGKPAVEMAGDHRMVVDECVSKRLTLKSGPNIVRVALINGPGLSDLCARFVDESGEPITELTTSLENPEK